MNLLEQMYTGGLSFHTLSRAFSDRPDMLSHELLSFIYSFFTDNQGIIHMPSRMPAVLCPPAELTRDGTRMLD